MTWSIVARDPESNRFGIAISTCALAVGAICPWTRAGVGAVSTQATSNPLYGPAILDQLAAGATAEEAITRITAGDDGRAHRQVHAISARGDNHAFTGDACIDWCGHLLAERVSVAGNMLAGAPVVEASMARYEANTALPFADRLLTALEAGQAAGGDKRGRQSAALLIQGGEVYADLNLRVDDHADPMRELWRIYELAKQHHIPYRDRMPTAANPAGVYGA